MFKRALGDALAKLNPAKLLKNPVIFSTWIVALLATVSAGVAVASGQASGAVSLTLKVLHFEGCKPLVEKAFYETAIV